MTGKRLAIAVLLAGLWMLIHPGLAHAWTPGTHIYLGETILANLRLLPPHVATLLQAFPFDFLYGTIAPDTSIAKKYVPEGRHSHYWNVGQETLDRAPNDALRAFGLGYLSHLAADTIAHNYFVPRQLVLTTSTRSMGHTYWETRIDTHLSGRYARRAREIILLDQTAADKHLERIISPTLFSVKTNRRLFRGMVHLAHTKSWHRAMQAARDNSRWLLTDLDVERNLGAAYDVTVEMLAAAEDGNLENLKARGLDPNGHLALRAAKRMRRRVLDAGTLGSPSRLVELAEENFGVRSLDLGYWKRSEVERPWLAPPRHPEDQKRPLLALPGE
ncbi:MAG TPA: zinc dependent phospholipase C family protein [Gemmatimonadales bacterium]|nr:zinc dependent phospholipase C family protein [Gemmatimonadales bacterium]